MRHDIVIDLEIVQKASKLMLHWKIKAWLYEKYFHTLSQDKYMMIY